ncbi:MAG: YihY/virulence factor BrkB family protein, partial [Pseudomonadota bacterium]
MSSHYETLRIAASSFVTDRTFSRAAALAFYTLFSLAPLLIIAIALIGVFVDEGAAREQIVQQLGSIVGGRSAEVIDTLLRSVATPAAGPAALVGIATLLIGATSVFAELKDGLDQIWELPANRTRGLLYLLRKRLLSFGLVLAIGFLLLVSLLFSAAVAALQEYLALSESTGLLLEVVNFVLAFVLVTTMFAVIYK